MQPVMKPLNAADAAVQGAAGIIRAGTATPASCWGDCHAGEETWLRRTQRSPARVNGTVSGATAPPEMMKLIAWSTVQSVGVSNSTGTISR